MLRMKQRNGCSLREHRFDRCRGSQIFKERLDPRREGGRLSSPQSGWHVETRGSSWPSVQDWAGAAALAERCGHAVFSSQLHVTSRTLLKNEGLRHPVKLLPGLDELR
jgi:hypothetical protein